MAAANQQAQAEREAATRLADRLREEAIKVERNHAAQTLEAAAHLADQKLQAAVAATEQRACDERESLLLKAEESRDKARKEGMQEALAAASEQQQATVKQAAEELFAAMELHMNGALQLLNQQLRMGTPGNGSPSPFRSRPFTANGHSVGAAGHESPPVDQSHTPAQQPQTAITRESVFGSASVVSTSPGPNSVAVDVNEYLASDADLTEEEAARVNVQATVAQVEQDCTRTQHFQLGAAAPMPVVASPPFQLAAAASTPVGASRPPPPGGQAPSPSLGPP